MRGENGRPTRSKLEVKSRYVDALVKFTAWCQDKGLPVKVALMDAMARFSGLTFEFAPEAEDLEVELPPEPVRADRPQGPRGPKPGAGGCVPRPVVMTSPRVRYFAGGWTEVGRETGLNLASLRQCLRRGGKLGGHAFRLATDAEVEAGRVLGVAGAAA